MRPCAASLEQHELVPIIGDDVFPRITIRVATAPILLEVMEHRIATVVVASSIVVLLISERPLGTPFVRAYVPSILVQFGYLWLVFLFSFFCFGQ